jgi:hypothetical protein
MSRKSAGHILSTHHEEPRNGTLCCTAQEQLINCHACELGIFGHILFGCIDCRVIETNCLRNYPTVVSSSAHLHPGREPAGYACKQIPTQAGDNSVPRLVSFLTHGSQVLSEAVENMNVQLAPCAKRVMLTKYHYW